MLRFSCKQKARSTSDQVSMHIPIGEKRDIKNLCVLKILSKCDKRNHTAIVHVCMQKHRSVHMYIYLHLFLYIDPTSPCQHAGGRPPTARRQDEAGRQRTAGISELGGHASPAPFSAPSAQSAKQTGLLTGLPSSTCRSLLSCTLWGLLSCI